MECFKSREQCTEASSRARLAWLKTRTAGARLLGCLLFSEALRLPRGPLETNERGRERSQNELRLRCPPWRFLSFTRKIRFIGCWILVPVVEVGSDRPRFQRVPGKLGYFHRIILPRGRRASSQDWENSLPASSGRLEPMMRKIWGGRRFHHRRKSQERTILHSRVGERSVGGKLTSSPFW